MCNETIKQKHSGSGDNVAGNKSIYQLSIEKSQVVLYMDHEKKYTLAIDDGNTQLNELIALSSTNMIQNEVDSTYYDFSIEFVVSLNRFSENRKLLKHKNFIYLKALKNNLLYYYDIFQADGKIFNIKTSPNLIEHIKHEESLMTVKYRFPKVLNKNDSICHKLSCEYIESFQNEREYWIINPVSPTKKYYIKFISPHNQLFKGAVGLEKHNNFKEEICNIQPEIMSYGSSRNCLVWELENLKKNVKYKIEWDW